MSYKIQDKSGDRNYFVIIPQIVWALSRDIYDLGLWYFIKMVAGDHGECILSTQQLADGAMMSGGKVSDSRRYLLQVGLLEGEKRKDPDHQNKVWHLRVPDVWGANIEWRMDHNSLLERIEIKQYQKAHKDEMPILELPEDIKSDLDEWFEEEQQDIWGADVDFKWDIRNNELYGKWNKRPDIDLELALEIGQYLDREFKFSPEKTSGRIFDTWVHGLLELADVVPYDKINIVGNAYRHAVNEGLTFADPHGLVKITRSMLREHKAQDERESTTLEKRFF